MRRREDVTKVIDARNIAQIDLIPEAGTRREVEDGEVIIASEQVVAAAAHQDVAPAAAIQRVVARVADQQIIAGSAEQRRVVRPAMSTSLPAPPSSVRFAELNGTVAELIRSAPFPPRTTMLSLMSVFVFGVRDAHRVCQAVDDEVVAAGGDGEDFAARTSIHRDRVAYAIATGAIRDLGEVNHDFAHICAAQIADIDVVDAVAREDLDALEVVLGHDDVADVARQEDVVAARGERDVFVCGRAIEFVRIETRLAVDGVAAIAGIPDEQVITVTHECGVVAAIAVDDVVARAARQHIRARAALDLVVARAGVQR